MERMAEVDTAVTLAVLNERLAAIEEKLDDMSRLQERRGTDYETRLRLVEKWMYTVPASLATALTAAIYTLTQNT